MPVKSFTFICSECGKEKVSRRHDQKNKDIVFCCRECRYAYFRKDNWDSAGRYKQAGYWMLRINVDGKYQHKFEHVYVWEKHNGEKPKGHEIHHINGDKADNRIENLKLLKSGEHRSMHKRKYFTRDEELEARRIQQSECRKRRKISK